MGTIDLHTHTLLSDGELVPSELARRAIVAGYRALAMTDHVDDSNMGRVLESLIAFCDGFGDSALVVLPGVELTHMPPRKIPAAVERARRLGARVVVVHGETPVEPVEPGTNMAAIEAGADILAHPGLIGQRECEAAARGNILFEITARKGHSLANGHVAAMARLHGIKTIINSDAHSPGDLLGGDFAAKVARGAGLSDDETRRAILNAETLIERFNP